MVAMLRTLNRAPGYRPHRRWVVGCVAVLVAIAVSAAGCRHSAPPTAPAQAAKDRHLVPDTEDVRGTVPDRATLAGLLSTHVVAPHAEYAARTITSAFDARRLRAHQPYVLTRTFTGMLRAFRYEIDADRYLDVQPVSPTQPEQLRATVVTYRRTAATAVVTGTIDEAAPSLFAAMERGGETADLAVELAGVFAGEIDFNSELQPGDRYRLIVERIVRETGTVAYGPIAGAEFYNDGRQVSAIRFVAPDGTVGFYDEQGRSLKRFFLKSPLKFEPRVTSRFSYSRRHPVLNITRAHLGVDYAAPVGAPVVAVAHGVVTRAGFAGGAGRLVALRHSSGYETIYMHLSSIAVRTGQRISQGDVIGRVGSSGLSTGPHLDYRIKKNGTYVDPLKEHRRMPPGEPIRAEWLSAFAAQRDLIRPQLHAIAPQTTPTGAVSSVSGETSQHNR